MYFIKNKCIVKKHNLFWGRHCYVGRKNNFISHPIFTSYAHIICLFKQMYCLQQIISIILGIIEQINISENHLEGIKKENAGKLFLFF